MRAVGEHDAAVRRARLHADLRQPFRARRALRSVALKPSMYARSSSTVLFSVPTSPISPPTEIVTPFGCSSRTVCASVDALLVVEPLLLVERRLREIDQRRRVDVDVVEAGRDRFARELLHRVRLR